MAKKKEEPKADPPHVHKNCTHKCRCAAPFAFKCQKCARDSYRKVEKERGW